MDDYEEESWGLWGSVSYVVQNYGWHLLFIFLVIALIYNKLLKSYYDEFKARKFEREYAAKYHKNPDLFAAHVNAQQQWAEKLQQQYNKQMEEHRQKMKEKEERKKEQLKQEYIGTGNVLGSKKDDTSSSLRPDYNPLMGPGPSSGYRPPRRSPCGGGGCGRR